MTGLRGVLRDDKLMSREGSMGEETLGRGCSKRRIHFPCILPSVSSHACSLDVSCRRCTIFISKQWLGLFNKQHHYHSGFKLGVLYIDHAKKPIYIARLLMEGVGQRAFVRLLPFNRKLKHKSIHLCISMVRL
jgi:hypothetical protein